LHLTDPHLFADTGGELRGTVTYESLRDVLRDYRDGDWRADLVAMTGDLVQDDSEEAYDHLIELVADLGPPCLVLPGNHDVRPLMRRKLSSAPFQYCGTMTAGGWSLIAVDSCIEGSAGGRVSAAELDELRKNLAGTDAEHILVCLHHPPVEVDSEWLESVGLENRDDFLATVGDDGRVRGIIFGHIHQAVDVERLGIRIIGTPSTCRQFRQASPTFAVDDKPPAYRRLTLHSDGNIGSELVWLSAQDTDDDRD
jgi:Icc protein